MDHSRGDKAPQTGFVLGRAAFEKISAIEGIRLSREAERMFSDFDERNMSPEQRRRTIRRKHAAKD